MGGSSPKAEVSNSTIQEAEVAKKRHDLYNAYYAPVEREQQLQAKVDQTGLFRGRALSDVAQANKDSLGAAIQLGGGTGRLLGDSASNLSQARMGTYSDAAAKSQSFQDQLGIGVIKQGHGLARDVQTGLAESSRAQSTEALGKARAQSIVNEGIATSIGALAGAGAQKYADYKQLKDLGTASTKLKTKN